MNERDFIRDRLRKYNLSYVWLINQLKLRGIVTDKTEMSSVIAGARGGPKAESIIQTSVAVLNTYEQGSVLVANQGTPCRWKKMRCVPFWRNGSRLISRTQRTAKSSRTGTSRNTENPMIGGNQCVMKSNIERNMVNKTLGNRFEAELCEMLAEHGFWAHNMAQNQTGQPADVIAARNEIAVLIDCKVCSNNTFPLSRIEPNQESAMDCWERCGNAQCYFALKLNTGEIYMAYWDDLQLLMTTGQRGLNESEIRKFPTFEEWVGDLSW